MKAVLAVAVLSVFAGCSAVPPAPGASASHNPQLTDEQVEQCKTEGGCALITRKAYEQQCIPAGSSRT